MPVADRQDKWTAFLMSLFIPGAGQLWSGSAWCLAWFTAAAVAATSPVWLRRAGIAAPAWSGAMASAALGLVAAEHAKRLLEPRYPPGTASGAVARVILGRTRSPAIDMRLELDIPRPLEEVWAVVADFRRFACIDPFHTRVVVLGPTLAPGVELVLEHRAFGLAFRRFGRLLSWRAHRGYAFSDLSGRGPGRGFPHVFSVELESIGPAPRPWTRLTVRVRGKWTSRLCPTWLARGWLRYVAVEHARLLRAAL